MQCCKGQAYDRIFDARTAARELRAYERRGPRGATARLLQAIRAGLGPREAFTHLDIGGGVGVLQHELASAGASQITAVDASGPYLALLEGTARRLGYADRQVRIEGDFVRVAGEVGEATVVTLDKVICCYPDMPQLVGAAARKATGMLAVTVPRDAAWTRWLVALLNGAIRYLLRQDFRVFVHPHSAIDGVAAHDGLTLSQALPGLFWVVRVYTRPAASR
jgi:2-polyprenyl-3-methyl-5-hydroxy-6-metoxy-1,4-benzoquinol methylase